MMNPSFLGRCLRSRVVVVHRLLLILSMVTGVGGWTVQSQEHRDPSCVSQTVSRLQEAPNLHGDSFP